MKRHCRFCGFNNPPDAGDCLYCHRSLPATIGQVKETLKNFNDISQGNLSQVGQRIGGNLVADQVSSLKYRFHPVWFLKLKFHGLKKTLINVFWIIFIIGLLVIMGIAYKAIGGKL